MSQGNLSKPGYRPEIDGLRAIAILPVILYHAGLPWIGGGYIGVDVFFVISGFLITSLILHELNAGNFSFIEFWIRRARRIIPALFVVVIFTLVVGWFIFFPTDYKDLGRTALSQAFFSSNIYLWLKSGYFAAPSETKPLLHTWSLSVEEQYYVLIPLTLFVLTKYMKRFSEALILVLLALSFLVSAWSSFTYPDAAFYLPHTRAWELLIGTFLAMLTYKRRSEPRAFGMTNELFSASGLVAIACSATFYSQSTPFPGVAALAPCLGTAAIIWANNDQLTYTGRLLASKSMVAIGLISYSLYLWHWPLLAFARYSSTEVLSTSSAIGVCLFSSVLAWLSYKYVETPFRKGAMFRRRLVVIPAATAALFAMFALGAVISQTKGMQSRESFQLTAFETDVRLPGQRERLCNKVDSIQMKYPFICRLGAVSNSGSKMLVVGDSYAEMYLNALSRLSSSYNREVWFILNRNLSVYPNIIQTIEDYDVSDVVLAYSWNKANKNGIPELTKRDALTPGWVERFVASRGYNPLQTFGDTKAQFRSDLRTLASDLLEQGVAVTLVDSPPYYSVSVPLKLGILARDGSDPNNYGSHLSDHLQQQQLVYEVFNEIRSEVTEIVNVTDVLCDQSGFCRTYVDGHSLYSDNAHLSEFGAEMTMSLFEKIFSRTSTASLE